MKVEFSVPPSDKASSLVDQMILRADVEDIQKKEEGDAFIEVVFEEKGSIGLVFDEGEADETVPWRP